MRLGRFTRRSEREALGALVEAYLSGGFEPFCARLGDDVPAWARMNRLAHASLDVVRSVAGRLPTCAIGDEGVVLTWEVAEWLLARDVVAVASTEETLRRVQARALVPLESRLIDTETEAPLAPVDLVRAARAALRSLRI